MNILCFGLSHQNADVALREKFAFADREVGAESRRLGAANGIDGEAVIVSTCNRVELYVAASQSQSGFAAIERFLRERAKEKFKAEINDTKIDPATLRMFYKMDAPRSVRHLFRVVCGLESMVLGETEILGQIKKAYSAAVENGSTARHLNKLFQRAFNVAKEVRTKTQITRGPVSVGSVAVDLAEKIFGRLGACKVMILGAGETSELTARALFSRGAKSIFVTNRSFDRASALAAELHGEAIHFDQWHNRFSEIDILISSTAAPHALVTREKLAPVMRARRDRPLFVIDLAVPRDVEPAVNKLDGVYLYDIDSLRAIAEQSLASRRQELSLCEILIERHVAEFSEWLASSGAPIPNAAAARSEKEIQPDEANEAREQPPLSLSARPTQS